ncbi:MULTISPECIES: hypothetical protein [Haloarcula]|uniref:hypothetical protein n=1 Tax=Haloarcula TaxID=2237 RepID=UPI0007BB9628|nr:MULTISPECIES: hypothetical protein [Haloarcula]KZX49079.1 hypothetical protein AV929_19565 [Haloarcula sp. K1]
MTTESVKIAVDGETVSLVDGDSRIDIGTLSDLQMALGGETYTITYDDEAAVTAWSQADPDGAYQFEVADVIDGFPLTEPFVDPVLDAAIETNDDGVPEQTAVLARVLREIWDAKGNAKELS